MSKFTGARGKSGSNDANAEFVGEVRAMFAKDGVVWQTLERGSTDRTEFQDRLLDAIRDMGKE